MFLVGNYWRNRFTMFTLRTFPTIVACRDYIKQHDPLDQPWFRIYQIHSNKPPEWIK